MIPKEFETIDDVNQLIYHTMCQAKNAREKKISRDYLATKIFFNKTLLKLFKIKSSFTEDEQLILERLIKMQQKDTKNYHIDPSSMKGFEDQFGDSDFPEWDPGPIASNEQEQAINTLYESNPNLNPVSNPKPRVSSRYTSGTGLTDGFELGIPWIQTYSGRRFNPTKPNYKAIVIQDIAHALSMQCRFSGHCKSFYSVAQHCVLVSHLCNIEDALWGLLHDASEAYLVDMPRPLKHSGKMQAFIEFENEVQKAICQRFNLPSKEPPSVKRADTILLATEARDLMSPLHPDWKQPMEPVPFLIDPWDPTKAEEMYLKRFYELI